MDLATASGDGSDDEWELCNDDGFIYKRKKRRLDPSSDTLPPADSGAAEDKFRNDRRKNTLLRIRDRYQRELDLWEHLSSARRALQERAEHLELRRGREEEEETRDGTSSSNRPPDQEVPGQESGLEALIDKLLLKADAREAIIQNVSDMCDVAESLCQAREDEFKQSLIDLPVWASPQDLMAALSDD